MRFANPKSYFTSAKYYIRNAIWTSDFFSDYPLAFAVNFMMKSGEDVSEEHLCKVLTVSGHKQYVRKNSKKIALVGKLFSLKVMQEIAYL